MWLRIYSFIHGNNFNITSTTPDQDSPLAKNLRSGTALGGKADVGKTVTNLNSSKSIPHIFFYSVGFHNFLWT
jgi:hypothetical protein